MIVMTRGFPHTNRARSAELNEITISQGAPYTLHDLTSSGLTMTWPTTAPNSHRVAGPMSVTNWGSVRVDFGNGLVVLSLHDAVSGASVIGRSLQLSALQGATWEA